MKKLLAIVVVAIVLTGLLGIAHDARAGHLREHQDRQKDRIRQGIASGQITPREARILYRDQRRIHQLKRHFLADGDLSGRERRILRARLERSSLRIYRYKHNPQRTAPLCDGGRGRGPYAWR